MKRCIFIGPSLRIEYVPEDVDVFHPAKMGSIFNAVEAGYTIIGLIDGEFGNCPAVWHREILWGLRRGCYIYGASSMGALRAAELYPYGMRGVGLIYRLLSIGAILDDDEVAVYHCPAEFGYLPLSEAMINIRATLRRLRRFKEIDRRDEANIVGILKSKFFGMRTRQAVDDAINDVVSKNRVERVINAYAKYFVDIKRLDAMRLVDALEGRFAYPSNAREGFVETLHWKEHFIERSSEIPPLNLRERKQNVKHFSA